MSAPMETSTKLRFSLPVKWSGPLRIGSGFGMREHPITHKREMHNGIDLLVPQGTPVLAVASGTVVERWTAATNALNGNGVRVDHAQVPGVGRVHSAYIHMRDEPAVQLGAHVAAGQLLGYVGSTGRSTGPHLHFGTKVDGKQADPVPLVAWAEGLFQRDGKTRVA